MMKESIFGTQDIMGSLRNQQIAMYFRKTKFNILVVGPKDSGKTSFIRMFLANFKNEVRGLRERFQKGQMSREDVDSMERCLDH